MGLSDNPAQGCLLYNKSWLYTIHIITSDQVTAFY